VAKYIPVGDLIEVKSIHK